MATLIFCLIFLQVTIFLATGIVLFTTFYRAVKNREQFGEETAEAKDSISFNLATASFGGELN